ncbi:hypothetical protein EXN66_Car016475 [Channa argus]|uniref:Uncharacterized protein n=1 Tax=Channa argus TaxID=215402 RepID=A0A6G1QE79_CHAAH|nr:hypothetical protein EXN66_Car016475 [Channa argus]
MQQWLMGWTCNNNTHRNILFSFIDCFQSSYISSFKRSHHYNHLGQNVFCSSGNTEVQKSHSLHHGST